MAPPLKPNPSKNTLKQRAWRKNNPELFREIQARWNENHPKKLRAIQKSYRKRNQKKLVDGNREWRRRNFTNRRWWLRFYRMFRRDQIKEWNKASAKRTQLCSRIGRRRVEKMAHCYLVQLARQRERILDPSPEIIQATKNRIAAKRSLKTINLLNLCKK